MISNSDSSAVKAALINESESYIEDLEKKFDVRQISFSERLLDNESVTVEGKTTNISTALNESRQRFYNQNVGGLVLLTDGIYNRGINPAYEAKSSPFPIYSVGFGDTTIKKDVLIERLIHNELTYLDNKFPVEVNIRSRRVEGEELTVLIKNNKGKEVHKESFTVNQSNHFKKVRALITADSVGLNRYSVSVLPIKNEQVTSNNYQAFNVEVVDNRKKILIVGSAPHPDIATIASSLKNLEKYEIKTAVTQDYDFTQKEPDLYILHAPDDRLLSFVQKSLKPYWIIYGQNVNPSSFTRFAGIRVGNHNTFEDIRAYPELGFSLFNLNPELDAFIERLPPLSSPFGKMQTTGNNIPLFYKKVRRVETTELLWFFRDDDKRRSAFIMGSGIWQWRMYNYRQQKNFALFDQLIAQTVQYLTAKREDQRFIVESDSRYNAGEDVKMSARLYNLSLELTNDPEVKLKIRSEKGDEFQYDFGKLTNSYELNVGSLPAGNYSWIASTSLDNEELERRGAFSIHQNNIEQSDLLARHDLLKTISEESNGQFYTSNQISQLKKDLLENDSIKSIQRLETNISSILNKKWIFFIFLVLLASEWGLRKYFGKY